MKGVFIIIKISLMIAIVVLAIIGALYVLDVFQDEIVKEALIKLMSVLGIFTVSSLLLLVIGYLGPQKDK